MTKTQEETLNKIVEKYDRYKEDYNELENKNVNYWWVELIKKDLVEISANTRTLKALERLGYIKIIRHFDNLVCSDEDWVQLLKRN